MYGGTYVVANTVTSMCDDYNATSDQRNLSKFLSVSTANISLNVTKDRIFTRMFGSGLPRPLPASCFGLFGLRDSFTIFASFNLAPMAAEHLIDNGWDRGTATTVAQLTVPVAMQWISAPLHLLGLDLYNNPTLLKNVSDKLNAPAAEACKAKLKIKPEGLLIPRVYGEKPLIPGRFPPNIEPNLTRFGAIRKNYFVTAVARSCRIGPAFGVGALLNTPLRAKIREVVVAK